MLVNLFKCNLDYESVTQEFKFDNIAVINLELNELESYVSSKIYEKESYSYMLDFTRLPGGIL